MNKITEIPRKIELKNRVGKIETVLELESVQDDVYKYKIKAQFPYYLNGYPGNYISIDFSQGPHLYIYNQVGIFTIKEICPPYILFELK